MLATGTHASVHPEAGHFLFQKYDSKTYGASPQNWAILEDRHGVLYFGNTEGLIAFDGVQWRRIPLPRAGTVRSLAIDAEGRVFVAGMGIAGYLSSSENGAPRFVSILDGLPESERRIGNTASVVVNEEGAWFSAPDRFLRWNQRAGLKSFKAAGDFRRAFLLDGEVHVVVKGVGLHRVSGDELRLVPGGEVFRDQDVRAAFPGEQGAILVSTKRLWTRTLAGFNTLTTDADPLLDKNDIYGAVRLPGGGIALGTTRGGLILLNAHGKLDRLLTKESGLPSNYIAAIMPDRHGGIWLATGNGIARYDPAATEFHERAGLRGAVFSVARWNGILYAGTANGLFRLKHAALGEPATFEPVEGVANAVYGITPLAGELWACTQNGLYRLAGSKLQSVLQTDVVFNVSLSPRDPDLLYVAGRSGVILLRRKDNSWNNAAQLPAAGEEFRSVMEAPDGKVWIATRNAILRADFTATPPNVERFTENEGIPRGWTDVFRVQARLVFATEKGLMQFRPNERRFVPDPSLGPQFADGSHGVLLMREDASRNLWITGFGYHGALLPSPDGRWRWLPMRLLSGGLDEYYNMHPDPDGVVWAAAPDGRLARVEFPLRERPPLLVQVRRVAVGDERTPIYGGSGPTPIRQLEYERNSLRLEFAAPFPIAPQRVEYQVLLEGASNAWSAWTTESWKDLSNLWEGSYRLRVRARNPFGQTSKEASYSLRILPPWYRRWWAYSLYVVAAAALLYTILRWRVRQLQAQNQKLEEIVHERTQEIRRQRDQIQEQEAKTESLLLNILPAPVAAELRSTGSVTPMHFDDVTVCFTDFAGFTVSSETLEAQQLVACLHEYFTEFDRIIAKYGLEKLKTIGDAYMFVSGLPDPRPTHAVDAVMAALEILESSKALAQRDGGMPWRLRVGLHSGPVVAGVVGVRKFAFDIWGDTVNLASRMESSGAPDRVNLSARTFSLVKDHIECEPRGPVRTKDGRDLEMFFANRVRQGLERKHSALASGLDG